MAIFLGSCVVSLGKVLKVARRTVVDCILWIIEVC